MPVLVETVEVGQVGGADVLVIMAVVHLGQGTDGLDAINTGAGCRLFQIQRFCCGCCAILGENSAAVAMGINDGKVVVLAAAVRHYIQPGIVLHSKLRICRLRRCHRQNTVAANRCREHRSLLRSRIHHGTVQFRSAILGSFEHSKHNTCLCLWCGIGFQLSTRCLGSLHHLQPRCDQGSNAARRDIQLGILIVELHGKHRKVQKFICASLLKGGGNLPVFRLLLGQLSDDKYRRLHLCRFVRNRLVPGLRKRFLHRCSFRI